MVELFEQNIRTIERQSSKGNQLKWENSGIWYKADYAGYEGLSEYVVSHLLQYSTLNESEYVIYKPEQIAYKTSRYNGVKSNHFLKKGQQIITLERLFKNRYGRSLYEEIWHIQGIEERIRFLCDQVENMTDLNKFDVYINKLMTLDAFFLNEDRHMHNIAVIMNAHNEFEYCRIFDNGASLLSDTTMDYPVGGDIYKLISECHAKTFSRDFNEQLEASERIAGYNLKFTFTTNDVVKILNECEIYSPELKTRVENILRNQMRTYKYLFA